MASAAICTNDDETLTVSLQALYMCTYRQQATISSVAGEVDPNAVIAVIKITMLIIAQDLSFMQRRVG